MGIARVWHSRTSAFPIPTWVGAHATYGHCDPHASHVDATSGHPVGLVQITMFYSSPCRDPNPCALESRNSSFWQEVSKAREDQGKGLAVQ